MLIDYVLIHLFEQPGVEESITLSTTKKQFNKCSRLQFKWFNFSSLPGLSGRVTLSLLTLWPLPLPNPGCSQTVKVQLKLTNWRDQGRGCSLIPLSPVLWSSQCVPWPFIHSSIVLSQDGSGAWLDEWQPPQDSMDRNTQHGLWGRKGGRGKPSGHELCLTSCSQDEQSSLSSILRHCFFTSSNKPHVWAIVPLFSWSCSQEWFPQPFLWGVKVTLEPGVLKDHYTSPARAAAHFPARGFHCCLAALSPGHFRLVHHRSPGYSPTGLVPWCVRAGEMALWDSLRNPLAHEKKDVNLQSTPAIVP